MIVLTDLNCKTLSGKADYVSCHIFLPERDELRSTVYQGGVELCDVFVKAQKSQELNVTHEHDDTDHVPEYLVIVREQLEVRVLGWNNAITNGMTHTERDH